MATPRGCVNAVGGTHGWRWISGALSALLLQTALEAEVTQFLGRDRYARGDRTRIGYRNGHAELTVKTTAGPVTLARPSYAARRRRSRHGCSARASHAPTRWKR
jgi:Transposase, Mutator family